MLNLHNTLELNHLYTLQEGELLLYALIHTNLRFITIRC